MLLRLPSFIKLPSVSIRARNLTLELVRQFASSLNGKCNTSGINLCAIRYPEVSGLYNATIVYSFFSFFSQGQSSLQFRKISTFPLQLMSNNKNYVEAGLVETAKNKEKPNPHLVQLISLAKQKNRKTKKSYMAQWELDEQDFQDALKDKPQVAHLIVQSFESVRRMSPEQFQYILALNFADFEAASMDEKGEKLQGDLLRCKNADYVAASTFVRSLPNHVKTVQGFVTLTGELWKDLPGLKQTLPVVCGQSLTSPLKPSNLFPRPFVTEDILQFLVRICHIGVLSLRPDFFVAATMSGVGKTVVGSNLRRLLIQSIVPPRPASQNVTLPEATGEKFVSHLVSPTSQKCDKVTSLSTVEESVRKILEESSGEIFIDFNGLGDAINENEKQLLTPTKDELINPASQFNIFLGKSMLGKRLIARGLLNRSFSNAGKSLASAHELVSFYDFTHILTEIFVELRKEKNIPDDRVALLFIHVDEFQLPLEHVLNVVDTFYKIEATHQEWEKKSMESERLIQRAAVIKKFREGLESIMTYCKNSKNNRVVLFLTGTSPSGINFTTKTFSQVKFVHLQPLNLSDSMEMISLHCKEKSSDFELHESWKSNPYFQRLVADFGGVPRSLECFGPHFVDLKQEYRDELFRLVANSSVGAVRKLNLGVNILLNLLRLSLNAEPVTIDHIVYQGEEEEKILTTITVGSLAFRGWLLLTPTEVQISNVVNESKPTFKIFIPFVDVSDLFIRSRCNDVITKMMTCPLLPLVGNVSGEWFESTFFLLVQARFKAGIVDQNLLSFLGLTGASQSDVNVTTFQAAKFGKISNVLAFNDVNLKTHLIQGSLNEFTGTEVWSNVNVTCTWNDNTKLFSYKMPAKSADTTNASTTTTTTATSLESADAANVVTSTATTATSSSLPKEVDVSASCVVLKTSTNQIGIDIVLFLPAPSAFEKPVLILFQLKNYGNNTSIDGKGINAKLVEALEQYTKLGTWDVYGVVVFTRHISEETVQTIRFGKSRSEEGDQMGSRIAAIHGQSLASFLPEFQKFSRSI